MTSLLAEVINFFNHPFFILIGGFSTLFMIIGFLSGLVLIIKGVIPAFYRLGIGLSKAEIAIFASINNFSSLKNMLLDSKLFGEKNIKEILTLGNIGRAEKSNIFLVHWKDFDKEIDKILRIKNNNKALIVYAPQEEGRIGGEAVKLINSHSNSLIVNFRGRLLNDILVSLITISYSYRK